MQGLEQYLHTFSFRELIPITCIWNGKEENKKKKKKKKNKKYPHCTTFLLLNSRKFQMEKRLLAAEPRAVDKSRLIPYSPLQSMGSENELTQKQTPYKKLPQESTTEHAGFFTTWNVSVHMLNTNIPKKILELDTSLQVTKAGTLSPHNS